MRKNWGTAADDAWSAWYMWDCGPGGGCRDIAVDHYDGHRWTYDATPFPRFIVTGIWSGQRGEVWVGGECLGRWTGFQWKMFDAHVSPPGCREAWVIAVRGLPGERQPWYLTRSGQLCRPHEGTWACEDLSSR